jgi:glucose-specific phosphotransferase system IIA component
MRCTVPPSACSWKPGGSHGAPDYPPPLSGRIWPLERVPDAVFAQKLVGDGVSIDVTDTLLVAACDGEVVSLHSAGHALTLRTPAGLDVLMHIGIDTVTLKGEGFQPRVKTPRYGSRGDPAHRLRPRLHRHSCEERADADRHCEQRTGDVVGAVERFREGGRHAVHGDVCDGRTIP